MFESFINPILSPFLKIPAAWSILLIAFIISLIITFAYKLMTDQELMKSLKGDMKKFQKEMKQLKSNPQKLMAVQKKAMEKNMKYMMHSMKPTIITLIPIIIIFGWLSSHYTYEPIEPNQEFTTTILLDERKDGDVELRVPEEISILGEATQQAEDGKASWRLSGEEGEYILEYVLGEKEYTKELLITSNREYKEPNKEINDGKVKVISIEMKKLKPFGSFKIFGWQPGWLGTYILFSIVFSMSLRKLLKLH